MYGIITLNSNLFYNFGCLLQSYALRKYLNDNHIPTEAIFCPSFSLFGVGYGWIFNHLYISYGPEQRTIQIVPEEERRKNAQCVKFLKNATRPRRYICYSKAVHRDIAKRYRAVIVGSDQVWNPITISCKTADTYFLSFIPPEKRFSYAASIGTNDIPMDKRPMYEKALLAFNKISVREDAGKRIVEELTGRTDVQVLADPTMLLTTQEWDAVAELPKHKLPERYLLTYFLGEVSDSRRQAIERKAAELDCETIWLMDKNSPFYAIGPGHFVYMIKHAQMVCTDSFHGSVFSFLYDQPLAIFDRKDNVENMSSRLETLASKFELHDCLVQNEDLSEVPMKPDYSKGYQALEEERKKSKAFLDMVFEETERTGISK